MKNHLFKSSALAIIVIVLTPNAYGSIKSFKQGFYAGGSLGAGWGNATWDGVTDIYLVNNQGTPLVLAANWVPDGDMTDTEFAGRAMLGYQFVFSPLYLAFEMGGTFSEDYRFNRDEKKEFFDILFLSTINASAITNDAVTLGGSEFNVDLKSGWLLTNQLLTYARVGLAVNKLEIDSNAVWTTTDTDPLGGFPCPLTLTGHGSAHETDTAYGIRLGLGAEFLATHHLGVTLDYIFSYYQSISAVSEGGATTAGDVSPMYYNVNGTNSPVVTVSTQTFMLGLLYHW